MARNVHRFRRLKHGNPNAKFKMLSEDIAPRSRRGLAWPLTVVAASVAAFGWSSGMLPAVPAIQPLMALTSPSCNIKGNISINTGERIYHVPGQKFYPQTRISSEYGERWFCTEAEARKAGWRKSKQ